MAEGITRLSDSGDVGESTSAAQQWLAHLTHLPLVPHICVSESAQHWFR